VKTGVQCFYNYLKLLDSGFRRNDDHWAFSTFYDFIKFRKKKAPQRTTPATDDEGEETGRAESIPVLPFPS